MKPSHLTLCVLVLTALLANACVPAATPPPIDSPAGTPVTASASATPIQASKPPNATLEPLTINNICTHTGERSEIQGILRLPDLLSCSKNEKSNWCTVQLYDPYFDKTLPVSLYVSASGLAANQMAAIPKNYGYADFKVQTGTGALVGDGSLVSLSGKISSAGQTTGGINEVACVLSDIQQVTALKQLTPVGIEVKKFDLAEAVAGGIVVAVINGSGLERLKIQLKSQGKDNLEIHITPGTIFESLTGGVQNMLVRKGALVVLRPNVPISLDLEVSCANMEKKEPGASDLFKISKSPVGQDLQKLVGVAEFAFASNRVQQFAVWTITDNPSKGSFVGIDSTSGLSGGPTDDEIAEIRRLFTAAGITPAAYNVFK